jgi:hypoxia up-regulated 1
MIRSVAMLCVLCTLTQGQIVGLDIGSEFMKIALVKYSDGVGEIITNIESKRKTQVVVGFNDGERVYAGGAMNLIARFPESAHTGLRMLLGRPLDHPRVKMLIEEEWYPGLLESDSKGRIVTVQDKGKPTEKKYSTEELLAMVLQYGKAITKAYAPKFVKSQIRDCVMTVPSFYTQHERQALLDTASIAGLKAKLIDENTAAAVQYAVDRVFNKTTKVLFYNLGANSLQVSIATFSSKKPKGEKKKVEKFAVNAKTFDETIGGRTFENKLMNFMADKFNEGRSGKPDIRKNLKAMAKMVTVAQKSKKTLSASKSTFIKMESLFGESHALLTIFLLPPHTVSVPRCASLLRIASYCLSPLCIPRGRHSCRENHERRVRGNVR